MRTLDDLDIVTLSSADAADSAASLQNYARVSSLLSQTAARFDEFVRLLPSEPDEFVGDS